MLALASASTAHEIAVAVIWVAVIVAVVAWHWVNRRYPRRWDR